MVAALWKSAQALARSSLATFQAEAAALADAAKVGEADARAAQAEALAALGLTRTQLSAEAELTGQLRQELAAAAATKAGLEPRLGDLHGQLGSMQKQLDRSREDHAADELNTIQRR